MNMNAKIIVIVLMVFTVSVAYSQEDKDVRRKNVPVSIREYIEKTYPGGGKVKYYKEFEEDSMFYQASFKFKNDSYTLLFLPDGALYETEIVMCYEELPPAVKEKISKDLASRYTKYAIRLVEQINPKQDQKYEIKVRASKVNHNGYFEVFYDREGNFLEEEEETLRSIPSNSGF
jgi:hypothetical protein